MQPTVLVSADRNLIRAPPTPHPRFTLCDMSCSASGWSTPARPSSSPARCCRKRAPRPPGSAPDRLTLDWNQAELAQYTRGDAIAITTYSAIFNLNSYLDDAQTLVFDDAHAAEGYVAGVGAERRPRMIQYEQLFDALGDSLEPSFVARMMAPAGPGG